MLKTVNIEKLNRAAYNPRIELDESMKEYWALRKSIETFGNVEPIVWNEKTGNVVGGHQRLKVLEDIGAKEVDCYVVSLSEEEEKILNLALNKIKGEWDYEKLEDLLSEIDDKELTGFSADELSVILAENEEGIDEDFDFSDFQPENTNTYESWIIDLIFESNEKAKSWVEAHGFDKKIFPHTQTTVIRIEE